MEILITLIVFVNSFTMRSPSEGGNKTIYHETHVSTGSQEGESFFKEIIVVDDLTYSGTGDFE